MITDVDAATEVVRAWVAQGPGTPAAVRWTERVTAQTLWELCGATRGAGVEACELALDDAAAHGLVLRLAPEESPWEAAPFPPAPPACVYVRNPCAAADGRAGFASVDHSEGLSEAELYAALAEDEEDREELVDRRDGGADGEDVQKWDNAADDVMRALGVNVPVRGGESSSENNNSSSGAIAVDDSEYQDISVADCALPWKRQETHVDAPVDAPVETTEKHSGHKKHKHSSKDNSHPGYKVKGKVMIALDPETLTREQAELREANRHNARQGRAKKSNRSSVPYLPR